MSLGTSGCNASTENYEIYFPDSRYKSVIFFEDNGVRLVTQDRFKTDFVASLRLVCWFNKKKINPSVTRFDLIQNLNNLIVDEQVNTTDFNRLYVEFKGEAEHSEGIYSKYDLDVAMYQYMMHPYELFALDYDVNFTVTKICIDEIELNPDIC